MKVVVNRCYGGFGVTEAVYKELGLEWDNYGYLTNYKDYDGSPDKDLRCDPDLIAAIEKLGSKDSSSWAAELEVVEIPDGIEWDIEEYDGKEWIAESHRTW